MDLTNEQKLEIVNAKISQYNAQIYSLKLDLTCAEVLEDAQWKEKIRESTKRLMQIIETLNQEIADLTNKNNVV